MKITKDISMLSVLLTVLFAYGTVWTSPAGAATNRSEHTGVKKAEPRAHKKLNTARRHKRVRLAKGTTRRAPATGYSHAAVPRRRPVHNWTTAATYGGRVPQTAVRPVTPRAQPRTPGRAPATACYNYNPCGTCWSVPYYQPYYQPYYPRSYQWNAPATYGGAPQRTTTRQSYVPPRAQPARSYMPPRAQPARNYTQPPARPAQRYAQRRAQPARSYTPPQAQPARNYAQRPAQSAQRYALPPAQPAQVPRSYPQVAKQAPVGTNNQSLTCSSRTWWDTWPLSYLNGWCL